MLHSDSPNSIEHQNTQRAVAQAFQVALVIVVSLGAWFIVDESYTAAALTYIAAVVLVLTFWLNHLLLRRRS